MKRTTSMTMAVLIVFIATSAAAPAFAQDQAGPNDHANDDPGRHMHLHGNNGPRGFWMHRDGPGETDMALRGGPGGERGGLLGLVCSPEGADRLEHMLLTISQRTDLTTEQQPLFDTLKTAALTAQTDFADACAAALPDRGAEAARPDLADRLKTRLDIEKAHVEAMAAVVPAFEAFYGSLTDAQKQQLEPRRDGMRMLDEPGRHDHRAPNMEPPQEG